MAESRNEPFTIGSEVVSPGQRRTVDLHIAELSTSAPMTMPVHVVCGRRPGPTLLVSAAIHGDEISGVEIIRRVLKVSALRSLRGTLVAVPIVNVFGFMSQSRYLPDRRDLNRSFPGSPRGSLASRLAHLFFVEVVRKCSHGIDLHTGALNRANYPQVRANLDDSAAGDMAMKFGVPVVINATVRDGSLRQAASTAGVPVIVYEAGEALRFDEMSIRAGVKGVVRIMRGLGMLHAEKRMSPLLKPIIARSTTWIRAPGSGILRTRATLGAHVQEDDSLGFVSNPAGDDEIEIKAPVSGVVIGRTHLPLVYEGDALFHLARVEGTQVVAETLDAFSPEEAYAEGLTAELADDPIIS